MSNTNDSKFDLRTRERALRDGNLNKEELQKHLKSLPDEAANTEEIPVFEETPAPTPSKKTTSPDSSEPTFSAVNE